MKILPFSDLHRSVCASQAIVAASQLANVVIGAGDFATRGEGCLDTLRILKNCACPVAIVHGNHDNPSEISRVCADWSKLHYLHGNWVDIGGVNFFGLGGEIPSRNAFDWNALKLKPLQRQCWRTARPAVC